TAETRSFGLVRADRKRTLFRADAPLVEPVSAVGSGDVLLAAFLAARVADKSFETSLKIAVAAAAASTLEVGAGRFEPRQATRLPRGITIQMPIVSAAMDTVTEARLAIALAREGGMGILHRNLSIDAQMAEVDKVKRSESGMIVEPLTLPREAVVSDALELMATYHISGVPITDESGTLVGILTNRDLRFAPDASQPVSALMTSRDLVTAPLGTTLAEAEATLHRHKIEKLPVVDSDGVLKGLITVKDIQ